MIRSRRVGGIRFVAVGRLRFSYCIARRAAWHKPSVTRRIAAWLDYQFGCAFASNPE